MTQGAYPEACKKLEESDRLDPALGTLFNLADCYEKSGRTASAWSLFLHAAAASEARGQHAAAQIARERADGLSATVPQFAILVPPEARIAGLVIRRGEDVIGEAQWNTPIAVNPGSYAVSATAPGHAPWSAEIVVANGDRSAAITVPVLQPVVPKQEAPLPTQARPGAVKIPRRAPAGAPSGTSSARPVVLAVGAIGAAGVGASLVLGALALAQYHGVDCPEEDGRPVCSKTAGAERDAAYTKANVATIVGAVGVAALATSTVLWLTWRAPDARGDTASSLNLGIAANAVFVRGAL